jgi:PEP-CTERM motif
MAPGVSRPERGGGHSIKRFCRSPKPVAGCRRRQHGFAAVPLALVLAFVLLSSAGFAQSETSLVAVPSNGITFSDLSGPNLAPFTGIAEGGFVVTPTSGTWLQAMIYGNPGPSIADGPVNAPGIGVIQVTDGAGLFSFEGFDFSSNNGDSTYDIQGFQGASLAYEETGTLAGTFGPFSFTTLHAADPTVAVNGLLIEIIPGAGATSVNLDNIQFLSLVNAPEPGGMLLLGLGLAGFVHLRARSGK